MPYCFGLIVLLLYETVFANAVCSQTFNSAPGHIEVDSRQLSGYSSCRYVIRAPRSHAIRLNLTRLYGPSCLAKLRIAELGPREICPEHFQPPQLLTSRGHVLTLTYLFSPAFHSGFAADFNFTNSSGGCEFVCGAGQGCLSKRSLVCDGRADCRDGSDETGCPGTSIGEATQLPGAATKHVPGTQIIIAVIAIVLTLGLVACIVSHYKMGARSWTEGRSRPPAQPPGAQEHHHPTPAVAPAPPPFLQQHQYMLSNVPSVLYNPENIQERQRLDAAQHREHLIRTQSVCKDVVLDLPPHISLPDGEEQPYGSMKRLHLRDPEQESEIYRGCVRAPPNRTVTESIPGESPPPYRSRSASLLHKMCPDGTPLVIRSNSVSVGHCNPLLSGAAASRHQHRESRGRSWHSDNTGVPEDSSGSRGSGV